MFCIITPVFDDALRAINLLIKDLQKQTFKDFKHILISNGHSPKIQELVEKVKDDRFLYEEIPHENIVTIPLLIANLGKRRNYCLKTIKADRYFFLDADLLILYNEFFEHLVKVHNKADIIISQVQCRVANLLPKFPIRLGKIDMANYSFSRKIAEKYEYPTDYDTVYNIANDWRFYEKMKDESHYFTNILYAIKNGRPLYESVTGLFLKWEQYEKINSKLRPNRDDTNKTK